MLGDRLSNNFQSEHTYILNVSTVIASTGWPTTWFKYAKTIFACAKFTSRILVRGLKVKAHSEIKSNILQGMGRRVENYRNLYKK